MKKEPNFVYGKNPVLEALNSNHTIEKVLIHNTLRGDLEKEVRSICKNKKIPLKKVPVDKLDYLTRKQNHQGLLAFLSPINFISLQSAIDLSYDRGDNPFIIILEGISDVRNLGAIARSAHVFGANAIVYPLKHSAPINEDAIKISAGALLKIPVCRMQNMEEIINLCKGNGLHIIGSTLENSQSIRDVDLSMPLALVMGNEERGITPETKKVTDSLVRIPQATEFDSLNVSVATGILAYEIYTTRLISKQ